MTRKDYEKIARAIANARMNRENNDALCADIHNRAIDGLAADLAQLLSLDNPRFMPKKFMEACEVGE